MANVAALHSLADGIARYLDRAMPADLRAQHAVLFEAVGSGGLVAERTPGAGSRITVWPYRVLVNEHQRNRDFALRPGRINRPLPLDVHLLLTVWSDNVGDELVLFAWAMRELYRLPVIDRSVLTTVDAALRADELIQLAPAEMTVEDMMRIWDAVTPSYRLSAPFVARVLQLDIELDEARPVVAQRLRYTDEVPSAVVSGVGS
jgi:Pvc16 N-terminal domain